MKEKMKLSPPWSIDASLPDSDLVMQISAEDADTMLLSIVEWESDRKDRRAELSLSKEEALRIAEMLKFFAENVDDKVYIKKQEQ